MNKKTWRHWTGEKYYEFKCFKVYWVYMHWIAEEIDKIGFPINKGGSNGEPPLLAYTNMANRYK